MNCEDVLIPRVAACEDVAGEIEQRESFRRRHRTGEVFLEIRPDLGFSITGEAANEPDEPSE